MFKKWLFSTLCLCPVLLNADVQLELTQGYRKDAVHWNMTRKQWHTHTKIKFSHIDTYTTRLSALVSKKGYFAQAMVGYGNILNGTFHVTKQQYDPARSPFLERKAGITGQYTLDSWLKVGKTFTFAPCSVAPFLGYGYFEQKMQLAHTAKDVLHHDKIHHIKNHYKARWFGPFLGLRLEKLFANRWHLFGEYTFLYPMTYEGSGKLGVTGIDSVNFTQKNTIQHSFGNIWLLGGQYDFCKHWSIKIEWELIEFMAKNGHQQSTLFSRHFPLKHIKRHASEARLCLSYSF